VASAEGGPHLERVPVLGSTGILLESQESWALNLNLL
jgi:hypothetical protein